MRSVALGYDTRYAYSADGNRAAKWTSTKLSETLYFNTMWTWHIDKGLSQEQQGQYSKHIYLGETRIVTKQTSDLEEHYGPSEELRHQYYYHPDHLGSAQLITDYEGNEYQRIEYTPYGELWVEKKTANEKDMRYLPYKFTAKEQDEETGLYYYGARYLDAKYSRWLSADPAVGEYLSKDYKGTSGGIYNSINLNLYHYANNNPVHYIDPDGKDAASAVIAAIAIDFAVPEPSDVLIVQKAIIYGVAIAGALAFDYIQRKKAEKILAELENTQKNNSTSEAADKARENFAAKTKPTEKSNSLPIDDAKSLLDTVKQSIINSKSKKAHEDQTYGKIRSEIENKLGRRLTKEEQRDWHTEMGNIKSRKATKGEKNPSLTEDELREAANDALDLN